MHWVSRELQATYVFTPRFQCLSRRTIYANFCDQGGGKVRFTEKETSILRYLYRVGQRPVSRETLLQEVWGYNSGVTTHTLEDKPASRLKHVARDGPVDGACFGLDRGQLHSRPRHCLRRLGFLFRQS